MKFFKRALKTLLCASLVLSLGISATACSTDNNDDGTGDNGDLGDSGYDSPIFTPPNDGSEGIDWSKYWDGVSTVGSSTDNFKFSGSKDIGTLTGDYSPVITPVKEGEPCIITFTDGVPAQSVTYGGLAVKPNTPENGDKMFVNWYTDSGFSNAYDFSTPVKTNLPLYAKWVDLPSNINSVEGNFESLAVTFSGNAATTVQYKKATNGNWMSVDKELVRALDANTARVDILGLAAGEYNVKIGSTELPAPVTVNAYDRSGYAHFNRTSSEPAYTGVGAYNDDGTLKDNALVIYVTDSNKDTVMRDLAATDSDVAKAMFKTPGSDWGGKNADGIGWWLNNNQYTSSNAGNKKNKVPSNTYDSANGGKLSFKSIDRPIVVRFIGTVSTPEGCTAFNDTKEGGGVGDNGHMARLKNLKNITLEGVGEDATIQGWGFHYVIGTDATNGQGTSFEVRNLTFNEYPEDAVGMEGQQAGGKITAAVSRCWIHNNTFLPGRCDNPAESDKKEGDGSCDFKRGEYYTCSYNYFEYCHKTNLIGSSDDSLQYNISMHHNMWYQCGSRIPLLRQANCHFYNNYVCGDQTEKTTPYSHIAKPALSYVHSLRANSYMFSEANYYEGSKAITDGKSGGMAKSWNDLITQCFGTNTMVEATTRDQKVSNNCKYQSTDYTSFDTDPSLFYYKDDKTDALLDGPVAARTRVLYEAGALGFTPRVSHQKTKSTPQSPSNVTLPKDGKAKGEILVFSLVSSTEVTFTTTTADLFDNYGRVYFSAYSGTKTLILPKGIYIVASAQKDKEGYLNDIKFVEGEGNSDARVDAAKAALAAIPSTVTLNVESILHEAKAAYAALIGEAETSKIDAVLIERYYKAFAAYEDLLAEYVVKRIEYIGEVTADSYVRINAAQTAYNKLSAENQSKVTNLSTLNAAWATFEGFAVTNVINRLNDLPDLSASDVNVKSSATVEKLYDWFNAVQNAYEDLNGDDNDKRGEVPATSLKKLTDGLTELKNIEAFLSFKETLDAAKVEDATKIGGKIVSLYNGLTEAQKGKLTAEEKTKFEEIKAAFEEIAQQTVTCKFEGAPSNNDWTVKGNYKSGNFTIKAFGLELSQGLKMESSTSVTFSTSSKMTLTLYFNVAGKKVKINDKDYTTVNDSNGDITIQVELDAGTHTITKNNTSIALYYATLTSAA